MDATYCVGSEMEMNRMFDQYLFKSENFDFMLPGENVQDGLNCYMTSIDQTFHTPSFGDDDFDIPPILPQTQINQDVNSGNSFSAQMAVVDSIMKLDENVSSTGSNVMQHNMNNEYHDNSNNNNNNSQGPGVYLQMSGAGGNHIFKQEYVTSSPSFETQPTFTTMTPVHSQHGTVMHNNMVMSQHMNNNSTLLLVTPSQYQNNNNRMVNSNNIRNMAAPVMYRAGPGQQFITTVGPYAGQHTMVQTLNGSPGSNQTSPGQETSEDSDDSTLHMLGGLKRPSPEPTDMMRPVAPIKKPKQPKKKKKRDPNEPQKPVSAYALFFRDTQAAIKGQNPNASFGEVSKIVASMWDSLEVDHKNVYKKKTESAKKEYLKALAAYRASLVSKGETGHYDSLYGASTYSLLLSSNTSNISSATITSTTGGLHHSLNREGSIGGGIISNNNNNGGISNLAKKSPLLTSLMETNNSSQIGMMPQQPQLQQAYATLQAQMSSQPQMMRINTGGQQMQLDQSRLVVLSAPMQQQQQMAAAQNEECNPMQTATPTVLLHQQQQSPGAQTAQGAMQSGEGANMQNNDQENTQNSMHSQQSNQENVSTSSQFNSGFQQADQSGVQVSQTDAVTTAPQTTCARNGCPNPAVDSPDWDSEYCSNECVVTHCRDVFTAWVASRKVANESFVTTAAR